MSGFGNVPLRKSTVPRWARPKLEEGFTICWEPYELDFISWRLCVDGSISVCTAILTS